MKLIDGKEIAKQIKNEIKAQVAEIIDRGDRAPHLAAILVGDDGASQTYVASKEKACREIGFTSSVYHLPENTSQQELLGTIDFLNADDEVDGYIVQLPLPDHIDVNTVLQRIHPAKDVDGFHPQNIGKLMMGLPTFIPATPYGIMQLIERYKIETEGKHCVVLGRSNIVGTPMALLMSRKAYPGNATVTLCHSKTHNLQQICQSADIIIAAIGQPGFLKANMVKEGAVIIDVGIHRIPDESKEKGYYITGDVDFEEVSKKASYITPVPGGVGFMTIVALLMNTFTAFKKQL
jgi:methylenetetrahydrofolate dehydrogenase (NADP+)/methenyltetrahydrofolate cyclohydrolase